jgi:Glycosyl transferase family 2
MTITESSRVEASVDLFEEQIEEFENQAPEIGLSKDHLLHGATVTVVFPCLNEELAVGSCVTAALKTMRDAGVDGSVIVVDNGSTDNSARIASEAGAAVVFEKVPGYGAALRAGIEAAQSEFVIMADADGTYELDAIPRLLVPILSGEADMVLGQRLSDATAETMPWLHRYIGTPVITFLVKKATKNKVTISDSQSGFRAFRRQEMLDLNLSSTGMEFASEMLIRSSWANFRIREVNTKYAERIGDSKLSTFSDGLRHLRQILLLSPETAAWIPGLLATVAALLLWVVAAQSTVGLGQVGSLSWVADVVAGILSIIGPLVLCTGLVLRYRAESLGLRTAHVEAPLESLIRKFFIWGVALVVASMLGLASLLISFHHPDLLSKPLSASLSSFVISSFVVGIILSAAPLIAPFLITSQRTGFPISDELIEKAPLFFRTERDADEDADDQCRFCLEQGALREA